MLNIKPVTTLTVALSTSLILGCVPTQQASNDHKTGAEVISKLADKQTSQQGPVPTSPIIEPQVIAAREGEVEQKLRQSGRSKGAMKMAARTEMAKSFGTGVMLNTIRRPSEPIDRENYAPIDSNQVIRVAQTPVSTFSIDVDTGAYSNVRRMLNEGRMPLKDAVRVEELINYFSYNYPVPKNNKIPFQVTTEVGPAPWNKNTHLLHIGIKGFDATQKTLPPSNLVFLVDVSGSMQSPDKLGLLKSSLKLLTKQLRKQDNISLAVYAGASGVVLESANGNEKSKIIRALESLTAGGSTNGAAGIRLAYQLAEQSFIKDGINRVLIATDGDFNVGTVSFAALKDLIEEKRKSGISLTTLGFGSGNYNDQLMEQLADAGNGNYAYIDTLNEAQKVLVDEISSTLNTIAKDVKIQIEFNPAVISEYRLIGYENRLLNREDFNNDKVDAGEIGAGHTVTALYEIAFANSKGERMQSLRYNKEADDNAAHGDEIALLRLRYKKPDSDTSKLIESLIKTDDVEHALKNTSKRFRFSAAVAGFGQLLRGGQYTESFAYDEVLELARDTRGKDPFGYRGEFIQIVNLAKSLSDNNIQATR